MGRHRKIDVTNLPTELAAIDAELARIEVRTGELKSELRGLEATRAALQERRSSAAKLDLAARLVVALGIDEAAYAAADDTGRDALIAAAMTARSGAEISGAGAAKSS